MLAQFKILITFVLFATIIKSYGQKNLTIYACTFDNGKIGYYALPCYHLNNSPKDLAANSSLIVKEEILNFKIPNQPLINSSIFTSFAPSQHTKSLERSALARKRCVNATQKIPLLIDILTKSGNDLKIKSKIKRSLYRLKKIHKNECNQDISLKT